MTAQELQKRNEKASIYGSSKQKKEPISWKVRRGRSATRSPIKRERRTAAAAEILPREPRQIPSSNASIF